MDQSDKQLEGSHCTGWKGTAVVEDMVVVAVDMKDTTERVRLVLVAHETL
jgi:hypothetical protein